MGWTLWTWSSYCSNIKEEPAPAWLNTNWILAQFGVQRNLACYAYQQFVLQGIGLESPLLATRHQLFLGDDDFVAQHQLPLKPEELIEVSTARRV